MGKELISTIQTRIDSLVFSAETEAKAIATLETLLTATVVVRGTSRTASGSPIYEERPDNGIRLAAAVNIVSWNRGKPKQMVEVETNSPGSSSQGMQSLAKLLLSNRDLLDSVISSTIEAAKLAQAIDVTSTSERNQAIPTESESGGSHS
jgi:hypothetical protein